MYRNGIATKILASGRSFPKREVSNQQVIDMFLEANRAHFSSHRLEVLEEMAREGLERTGNRNRYWCDEDEHCNDLAREASLDALNKAALDPKDLDLIIFTGMSNAFVEPATGHLLKGELGAERADVLDTQDACASFVKSLDMANTCIVAGRYRTVLIACGERTYDWADFRCASMKDISNKFASLTIGDAGGALVLGASSEERYTGAEHHMRFVYRSKVDCQTCHIGLNYRFGERYRLHSNAKKLMDSILELMQDAYRDTPWARNGTDLLLFHDVGNVIQHRFMPEMKRVGAEFPDNYRSYFSRYGNIASASLPVYLSLAADEGRVQRGEKVFFVGGAAGVQAFGCKFVY